MFLASLPCIKFKKDGREHHNDAAAEDLNLFFKRKKTDTGGKSLC